MIHQWASVMKHSIKYHVGTLLGRPRRFRYLERLPKRGIGAEIGVFRGEFTPDIIRITQPCELHLIDGWWKLWGDYYPDWGAYTEHGRLATVRAYTEAQRRTAGKPVRFHVGDDLQVLPQFSDGFFDWVYLDSSHQYEHTMRELEILQHKVREVIMGDDWRTEADAEDVNAGGARAIREFCRQSGWRLLELDPVFGQWSIGPPT
jgi:hypothetical protein